MRSSNKWKILAGHWTIKPGRQNGRLLHWPKRSCTKTKLWKLLLKPAFVPQAECAVARQNFSLLATAHDCERGKISPQHIYQIHEHFAKMSFSDTETGMVVYFLDVPCLWDLVRMQRGLVLLYKINCWKITIMKYIWRTGLLSVDLSFEFLLHRLIFFSE